MAIELLERDTATTNNTIEQTVSFYLDENTQFLLKQFLGQVKSFFELNPALNSPPLPVIHSVKSRIKNPAHLEDKIKRKQQKGIVVTPKNLFEEITDLIGVRVLHLYQDQFEPIHTEIVNKVNEGDWLFCEEPKAYSWDPENDAYFASLGISTEIKESYYTSVHYLVKPNNKGSICCEIQVRTLFEEIWGEIDHAINYPHKTESVACSEQLRVLSKLVSAGTRLSDSIFRSYNEYLLGSRKDIYL